MEKDKELAVQYHGNSLSIPLRDNGYVSLTKLAKCVNKDPSGEVKIWIRNKKTVDFLDRWERGKNINGELNNPDFKAVESDRIKQNQWVIEILTPKSWCAKTNAIGIQVVSGRYGGIYAHEIIALKFAADRVSKDLEQNIYTELQQFRAREKHYLTSEEYQRKLERQIKRNIVKANHPILTNAIDKIIIFEIERKLGRDLTQEEKDKIYAEELDLLNKAMWNLYAWEWRKRNPVLAAKGMNIRDDETLTGIAELNVLNNLEQMDAALIMGGIPPEERLVRLRDLRNQYMALTANTAAIKRIETLSKQVPQNAFQIESKKQITNNQQRRLL